MVKNAFKVVGMCFLLVFSFYYTNKAVVVIKSHDPIMKELKAKKKQYEIAPEAMKQMENGIIPGYNGREVDVNHSYQEMVRYGNYHDTMLVFDEVKPKKSASEVFDQYLIAGNPNKAGVSLVFKVTKTSNLRKILKILEKEEVKATFFVDGVWIESNKAVLDDLFASKHEIENYGYDGTYEQLSMEFTAKYIEAVTGKKGRYCLFDQEDEETLNLCKEKKLQSVKPQIVSKDYLYKAVWDKLESGSIISMNVNMLTETELGSVIQLIRSKGYQFYTLENLLKEERN